MKRNTNDFFSISNSIHVQYKMDKHLVLFKNDIEFQKIEGDKFENFGISHLRYNYRLRPRLTWEVFIQGQYNKVSKIDFRGLLGTGPRFKLTEDENYKFYFGVHAMYEYEEISDGVTPDQRDIRGSSYFSFSLYPLDNLSLTSTTYYQPRFSELSDYRISSQSSIVVKLIKNFAMKTTYTFTYDAAPALGIPNSQYDLSTGLAYTFD
ncbi:DUF481 domain-containing protein [Ulvibacter antarcticus]|uniref:DUF481 domain-containing protein n=1 Tax=Ulvibacter antarcticus TaxID=442714 RepID=UPI001FE53D17|nr:DUF481 domain-containing protein [Ulvibacter antarcticus]